MITQAASYKAYVLLIVQQGDKVLLIKRNKNAQFGPGLYSLVGGKVDEGELLADAIVRETYEEVGVRLTRDDLQYVHTCNKIDNSSNRCQASKNIMLIAGFKVTSWQGDIVNKEPEKHDHIEWFSYDALPSNILPTHKLIIELSRKNILFSEVID